MLVRPQEPVFPSSVTDAFFLTELIENLMNSIGDSASCRASTLIARKALSAAEQAARYIREQNSRIALLEQDAVTDPLTGILNRRGFEAELHRALSEGRRYKEHGALIYLDMDGFKQINDTLGHSAGDAMLCKFADILTGNVRDTDRVGRLGGDEFAILMGRTSLENAAARAETIEWIINASTFEWEGQPLAIQASLGTDYFGPGDDGKAIILRADEAMYQNKQERRKQPRANFTLSNSAIPVPVLATQTG